MLHTYEVICGLYYIYKKPNAGESDGKNGDEVETVLSQGFTGDNYKYCGLRIWNDS